VGQQLHPQEYVDFLHTHLKDIITEGACSSMAASRPLSRTTDTERRDEDEPAVKHSYVGIAPPMRRRKMKEHNEEEEDEGAR